MLAWSATPAGSTVSTEACSTDAAGQCVITVDSNTTTGTGVLQVVSIEGTPSGTDEVLTVTYGDADRTEPT